MRAFAGFLLLIVLALACGLIWAYGSSRGVAGSLKNPGAAATELKRNIAGGIERSKEILSGESNAPAPATDSQP